LNEGTLTIGKAPLTITADDKQINYGDEVPTWTLTYSGFVNGDDATMISALSSGANVTSSSTAGTYPITLEGGTASNYEITRVNGTLTIGKTQLTVTADDQQFSYGDVVPQLSLSYQGFVNGDSESDIVPPTAATTAISTSNVGAYDITLSGGSADNYDLVLVNGTATISKANLSITADSQTMTYGESLPNFTSSITGLVAGDEAVVASLTYTTTASASPNAGTYTISPTGVTASNYNLSLVDGTLTVNKAGLTVTADNKSITYGESIPALTYSYAGFVSGDSEANITAPGISTTALNGSNAGTYDITLSGGAADNYNLTLTAGTLTINKATLAIKVRDCLLYTSPSPRD